MAVPARPASGAPIDSVWGGVAHDTAVAQDVQSGTWSVPANVGSVTVTFPRPFAAPPAFVVSLGSGSRNYVVAVGSVAPATAAIYVGTLSGSGQLPSVPTIALSGSWVAIGPRA